MEPKRLTVMTPIWLNGNPVFSLNYVEKKSVVYVDITGLRPDPTNYLKKGKEYDAKIGYSSEKDHRGEDQWVLKFIEVYDGRAIKFVNIR